MKYSVILFLFFFTALTFSCKRDCTNHEIDLTKIVENAAIEEYRGLRIAPYSRRENTTAYSTFSDKDIYLIDDNTKQLVNNPTDTIPGSAWVLEANKRIQTLSGLGIIAYISDNDKTLIYTNFQDSTFNDLRKANLGYFDKSFKETEEDMPYRYVLLRIHSNDSTERIIVERFAKLSTLKQIKKSWYYFRSQNYSNVCR